MLGRLTAAAVLAAGLALLPTSAQAGSQVDVANPDGQARIDPTYATTLTVSGAGFQSVRGGHGGIYVFFGTVSAGWQPSRGGVTGADYFYVPDSESKNNQGFQRYVAFPGSDTASSANGGTMSADGSWSTRIVVPGATFRTYDRSGAVHTVDCRKVTCGVITIGAHGVTNAHNETFTPVSVGTLAAADDSPATDDPDTDTVDDDQGPDAGAASAEGTTVRRDRARRDDRAAAPTLEVDRASAVAGHVLAFTATGLPPGSQVSAVFDDGTAGAGPFVAGTDGSLSGVLTLPADVSPGTHELRLYGVARAPSVSFAVRAPADAAAVTASSAQQTGQEHSAPTAAWLFAGAAGLLLLVAVTRLAAEHRRRRTSA